MKRSPSPTRGYLHQLAEPLPHHAMLLTPRRPAGRGVSTGSILNSIPAILDSIADTPTTDAPAKIPQEPSGIAHTMSRQKHSRRFQANIPVAPDPAAEPLSATSLSVAATFTSRRTKPSVAVPAPTQDTFTLLPPDALREDSTSPHKALKQNNPSLLKEGPLAHLPSSAANVKPNPTRDRVGSSSRVHIGTIEVRLPIPPRDPRPAPTTTSRVLNSGQTGNHPRAEPLSRNLGWNFGLVQG